MEVLDRYFGNVCELDLIFNFHKAYYILDELLIAGEQQETSKKAVLCPLPFVLLYSPDFRSRIFSSCSPHIFSVFCPIPRQARVMTTPGAEQVLKLIAEQDAVCEEGTDKDMQ